MTSAVLLCLVVNNEQSYQPDLSGIQIRGDGFNHRILWRKRRSYPIYRNGTGDQLLCDQRLHIFGYSQCFYNIVAVILLDCFLTITPPCGVASVVLRRALIHFSGLLSVVLFDMDCIFLDSGQFCPKPSPPSLRRPSFREIQSQSFTSQTAHAVIPGIRGHQSRTERGFGAELPGIQKDYAISTAVSLKQSLSNSG